jgi:hypothetical protein
LPFAGFYEVALDHDVRIAIHLDFQSFPKVARVVVSHVFSSL